MSEARKVYPVSVINQYVKRLLESNQVLSNIWIKGEISNFKRHSSGHLYFTLKDMGGQIAAVMFASDARKLTFRPEDGMEVEVQGAVSLYEVTGKYQFYVRKMERGGIGDLYQAFEAMKRKLEAEGLFDQSHKKPIPAYPRAIGIVTSRTGAAVRDIIQIAKRRNPGVRLVLCPAQVQGDGAADTIVRGIRTLDRMEEVDTIIVGRGGGSIEDLWPFNEESVARAIFACETPIISAVGHETDFTIADFVSDLRAPTPSAASELAVPDVEQILRMMRADAKHRTQLMSRRIEREMRNVDALSARLRLLSPQSQIRTARQRLDMDADNRTRFIRLAMERLNAQLLRSASKLEILSPLHPLGKGYAMITDENGKILSGIRDLAIGGRIEVTMKDGAAAAVVESIREGKTGDE